MLGVPDGKDYIKSAYSIGVWHKIYIEFDTTTDRFRFKLDEASWSSYYAFHTPVQNIDTVTLVSERSERGEGQGMYWDDIKRSQRRQIQLRRRRMLKRSC